MQSNLLPFPDGAQFDTDIQFWPMMPAEQTALIYLLHLLRPKVSIEVGTYNGGSLQVLSHFSSKVYSLDIAAEVPQRLAGKHQNVEYIVGDSAETFPILLKKLEQENAEVGFILIDGDHSTEAVRKDINAVLNYRPTVPVYLFMHDNFIMECRLGMCTADWQKCPYVHALEVDYIPGGFFLFEGTRPTAGMAVAYFSPERRQGKLRVTASYNCEYSQLLHSLIGDNKIVVH